MKAKSYLGILDWGIGGIGIYQQIKSRLGNVPIVYFSDTGVAPYGRMSRPELVGRLKIVIKFLREQQNVAHLVIGCNAASTVISRLNFEDLKVAGVIEPAVELTATLHPSRLALIGGRRTVLSGIYRRQFAERGIKIRQRIAQPLSALIESGDVASPKLRREVERILAPIKGCSHLLLACTHYPAISAVLKEFVSEKTVVIDPSGALIEKVVLWELPTHGSDIFLTTGDAEKMKTAAQNAFNLTIIHAQKITV